MRNASAAKVRFGFKGIVRGLLLILFLGGLAVASAATHGSFSGRVWNDLNNDGLMDASEPGVEGVTLALRRTDTGEKFTVQSDSAGAFLFAALQNGSYDFSVEMPKSMVFARYRQEGGDLRSVLTGEENDIARTFVIRDAGALKDMNVGLVDSAIIQGTAFLDLNYNGAYDEGEPPCSGVALEVIRNVSERTLGRVYTGENGLFLFDSVRTGNYRLRAILPDDGSTFSLVPVEIGVFSNLFAAREGHRENSIPSIDVENSMVYEFYVGVAVGGTVSGTVFSDDDYSGVMDGSDRRLSGVTVQLIGASGAVVAETSTGGKGGYTFAEVMPGEYRLRYFRKAEYTFTKYRPQEEGGNGALLTQSGDYGETEPFTFAMGGALTGMNAGMVQSATLNGSFFYDENDNGLWDAGEGGFTDGQVRLVSGDGEIDLTQPIAPDGSYFFSGVVPTAYTLYYLLPEHAEMAKVVSGGNTVAHQGLENAVAGLTLEARKNYTQPLAGAVKLGTFEGYVFDDLNADGVRGEGEAPVAGATVSIAPQNAPDHATSSATDADGFFSITGLRPGEYTLHIQLPKNMIFAGDILSSGIPLDNTNSYSAPVPFSTLLRRTDNAVGAVAPASIQASVWLDENKNGAQDAGERKLGGLEYTLYDEIRQKTMMTALSGEDGTASFQSVRPSTYTVYFVLPATAQPVAGVGTLTQAGATMRQTGIVIRAGDSYTGISGGLQCTTSIGGTVRVEQAGSRLPVAGAEIRLYAEGGAQPMQTAYSDTQGVYRFDSLWPGSYVIEAVRPNGTVFVQPDDPTLEAGDSAIRRIFGELGESDPFPLYMAQNALTQDVLLTLPAKVGNLAWLDENSNGLIDGGEPMIGGVTVSLMQNGAAVYTATTNEWGYYEFPDVYPGEYTLEAVAYPELALAVPVPELRIISNCLTSGDGSLAFSDPFSVTSGSVNFFYHLGYVLKEGATLPAAITESAPQSWSRSN